jgi:chromosome segregation ATPase
MEPTPVQEADSLAALEERIQQTAELVARLRRERDAALAETARLAQELADLRAERAQVRTRVEKLLGQIDALTAG